MLSLIANLVALSKLGVEQEPERSDKPISPLKLRRPLEKSKTTLLVDSNSGHMKPPTEGISHMLSLWRNLLQIQKFYILSESNILKHYTDLIVFFLIGNLCMWVYCALNSITSLNESMFYVTFHINALRFPSIPRQTIQPNDNHIFSD